MRQALLLLLACLFVPLASAGQTPAEDHARPVIRWLITDYPPAFILVDGQPTEGAFDKTLMALAQRWPEAKHQFEVTNPTRGLRAILNGEQACYVGVLQTPERERQAFLIPTHMIYPMHVVVADAVWDRVPKNAEGEVLLGKLLEQPNLRGILVRGRSYTTEVDAIIAAQSALDAVQYVVRVEGGGNILRMLTQSRADYTLEYPAVLTYQRQQNPGQVEGRKISARPIEGGKLHAAGILCPRTPWGSQTAQHIDTLIATLASEKSYSVDAMRWIPPEAARHRQKEVQNFYRQRAKHYPTNRYVLGSP